MRLRSVLEIAEMVLWIALFAVTPQVIVPSAYEGFLLPKFFFAETLIVILACLAIVLTLLGRPFVVPLRALVAGLAVYGLLHAVSLFWAASPTIAFDQARFWLLLVLAALLMPSAFLRQERRVKWLGAAMLVSVFVTALWVIADDVRQAFFPQTVNVVNKLGDWRGVLHAGLGNTSHIGDFLAIAYPFAFLLFLQVRRLALQVLLIVWLWMVYAGLIVSFSVHSNAGLILAMLLTLIALWRCKGDVLPVRRFAVVAVGWILIGVFFTLDVPGNPHRPGIFKEALSSERLEFGWPSRVFIWLTGLEMVRQHPFLGVGSGNFTLAFPQTHSPLVLADPELAYMAGSWTNAAHNELLQSWAEVGIAGPVALIIMAVLAFRALGKGLCRKNAFGFIAHTGSMAALLAFCVDAQMNFPLQMAHSMLLFVLLLSLAVILPLMQEREERLAVRLEYGWGNVRAEMERLGFPQIVSVQMKPRPVLAGLVAVFICLPLIALESGSAVAKMRSDIAYRHAHEANLLWQKALGLTGEPAAEPAVSEQHAARTEALFSPVFALWPQHHNARSEYSEFLVRRGRGEEAIVQVKQTMKRLRAWEVYLRLARAQWQAGQMQNARKSVARALSTRPEESAKRIQLAMWAAGRLEFKQAPPPPPVGMPTEMWGMMPGQ